MGHMVPASGVSGQIWQWKVFFNFITLIGYFMLVVPLAGLLLKLPFFKLAVTEKKDPVPVGSGIFNKALFWVVVVVSSLLPALLVPMLMERRADELQTFGIIALIAGGLALVAGLVLFFMKKDRMFAIGGIVMALAAGLAWFIAGRHETFVDLSPYFIAPAVNTIAYWAVVSGIIALFITAALFFFAKRPLGANLGSYGLSPDVKAICAGLATAVVTVFLLYILLFVLELIFKVDARVFTIAIRTFTFEHVIAALRYMPVFFIFYFLNTIAIRANAGDRKCGVWIAILLNIGGLVLWVAIQYIVLFSSGVAWYPSMALNTILLFALTPCLAIAAVYAHKLYQKTNNIYLPAFLNTIFFTMLVVANTAVFWNMVPAA
jgi:hypothetical protein